ncbi:MAG: biopolymer transporter ExbD [Chlamydiae bacterium]|nr:biopolymer transporter ExbD [Chlamydiota bacterium]
MRSYNISSETPEAPINLTPLIDVVFVMLIMFILVAPILEMDNIELAPSSSQSTEISSATMEKNPLTIHVRKDNTIWYNKEKVSLDHLKIHLTAARKKNPQIAPLLLHDKKAFFGTYQLVKNTAEEVGFKEINIVLAP